MQANTSTAYFTSNKFDLTEMTALLTLWMTFMIDGLTATLFQFCDWLEGQMMIQLGDLHEPNRTYSQVDPVDTTPTINPVDPVDTVTIDPVDPVETTPTIDPVDPTPTLPDGATMTYKDLQAMLKEYRDDRGEIQVKLNAKRDTLESEAKRLGLIA